MHGQHGAEGNGKILELSWHAEVDTLLDVGDPPLVMLVGEPGCGKTTFAKMAAERHTGQAAIVLSGSPETEQSHIFGRWTLAGQETRFMDGPLPLALKTGRWMLVEEFSQIPLEARSSFLPLRDQREITNPMNNEVLPIPAEFRLIATSNSESLTCRKNTGIAKVLYDGFLIQETPELERADVVRFLQHHYPQAASSRVSRVVELWEMGRELETKGSSGKSYLSYRAASHLMALLERGMTEERAVRIALVNKFLPSDNDLFSVAKSHNFISYKSNDDEAPEEENY